MLRDRKLNDLNPKFLPVALELLARCVEAQIQVMIIETLRTEEQHEEDVASGHSWVEHSKHQDGLAIDICPYEEYQLNGSDKLEWNGDNPVWLRLGLIGELLGLTWGGRWAQKDYGHFEMKG